MPDAATWALVAAEIERPRPRAPGRPRTRRVLRMYEGERLIARVETFGTLVIVTLRAAEDAAHLPPPVATDRRSRVRVDLYYRATMEAEEA